MAMFVKVKQADGSSHHKVVIRRKGHPTQSKTFPRKIDAEKWARRIEGSMDERTFHQPIKSLTYKLFEKYRDEVCPHRDGGKWEINRINKLIREAAWMKLPLSEADGDALQTWKIERSAEVSAASVNRELNLISGVFSHAIKEWRVRLPSNPVKAVNRPPKTKARRRRVLERELAAMWGLRSPKVQTARWFVPVMFEFAIETALRTGELCRLRWCDVNWEEKWIYVLPSKNGDERHVPLSSRALALLKMVPQEGERVFPVHEGTLGVVYREMCEEAGIVDLHFHDTRHEAVSRLAKIFPIMQLAAIIGHRDLKSLLVYYNPTPAELASHLHDATQPTPRHPLPTT